MSSLKPANRMMERTTVEAADAIRILFLVLSTTQGSASFAGAAKLRLRCLEAVQRRNG